MIARIKSAKELGDLKENADYSSAREEQSFLEGRIASIEALLRDATVIEAPAASAAGRIDLGSRVSIELVGQPGEVTVYELVGTAEADPAAGRISNASPVGRALIGRRGRRHGRRQDAAGRRRVPDRRGRLTRGYVAGSCQAEAARWFGIDSFGRLARCAGVPG